MTRSDSARTMARPALVAVPMHGEVKLRREGLRTRDGHLLEWFARLLPGARIEVHSRPEPWPRVSLARRGGASMPAGLRFVSPEPLAIPNLRHRRDWWVRSTSHLAPWPRGVPAVVWNPLAGAAGLSRRQAREGLGGAPVAFDLLDDWLAHPAFARLGAEVERSYAMMFEHAELVSANSEATLALAHRFGRSDAVLVRNGVDPERFALPARAHEQLTVGYCGKIGCRLDVELVAAVAGALPHVRFEFAGPAMAREQARALRAIPNARLLGDVRYDRYPQLMQGWDLAWAPHRLGEFEVGGDLIKLYEYRAAGLPTVSTRVIGWERALDGVRMVERDGMLEAIDQLLRGRQAGAVPREPIALPVQTGWRHKAAWLLERLGVGERASERASESESELASEPASEPASRVLEPSS